jgi:hypothetical protein
MALPSDLSHFFDRAEFKAACGAAGHAGRVKALVDSIHAEIAFFNLADLLVPLGSPPGTGGYAGFASHAKVLVHKYDSVFAALLHGAGGAGRNAPGVFAMKAGHINK